MCDTLKVTHKGTSKFKQARLNVLAHEQEKERHLITSHAKIQEETPYDEDFDIDDEIMALCHVLKEEGHVITSHAKIQEETPYDEDFDIDDEIMALRVNKFSKRNEYSEGFDEKNQETQPKRVGHIKFSCPTYLKMVGNNKKEESMDI
ncbi:hypothetical protein Lal_00024053 [Lupinus albus]|nr:hypothetical protein Lal_00024053 [Lupinus albus]